MAKLKSWRDNLKPASFRGVPFFVKSHDFTCGRWTQVDELVNPNGPSWIWITDKGGVAEIFDIDAYIIQNGDNQFDYFKNRDDLMEAVSVGKEMNNSGILIHPYLGTRHVFSTDGQKFSESEDEGGVCRIKLRFVWDTRQKIEPKIYPNVPKVDAAALKAKNISLDTSILSDLRKLSQSVYDAIASINSAFDKVKNGVSSVVAAAKGFTALAFSTVGTILSAPGSVMQMFKSIAEQFEQMCGIGVDSIERQVLGSVSGAVVGGSPDLDGTTIPEDLGTSITNSLLGIVEDGKDYSTLPTSLQSSAVIMNECINLILISVCVKILIRIKYNSRDNFIDSINKFSDAVSAYRERISEHDTMNDLWQGAEDLRTDFFLAAQFKLDRMARQIQYIVPSANVTTIHLAFNRYNDITRAEEIMKLNKNIRHPGFLPEQERIYLNHE